MTARLTSTSKPRWVSPRNISSSGFSASWQRRRWAGQRTLIRSPTMGASSERVHLRWRALAQRRRMSESSTPAFWSSSSRTLMATCRKSTPLVWTPPGSSKAMVTLAPLPTSLWMGSWAMGLAMASLMEASKLATGFAEEWPLALRTLVRSGRSTSIQWSPYQSCSLIVDPIGGLLQW